MQESIERIAKIFLEKTKGKKIRVISHFDTDGITSATIIARTLRKLDKNFKLTIIKSLEKEFIQTLEKEELIMFLDLGSSSLEEISKLKAEVFIIDHHEITGEIPKNIFFINPHLTNSESISGAGLSYLFSKQLTQADKTNANLAIIGMVGDMLDRELSISNNKILEDAELIIKKGPLLYPATRPINKTLEFSSSLFIPGITGNAKGVLEMLREIGISRDSKGYKSLIELDEEELSRLITAIILRTKKQGEEIIGNIYLVKLQNKLEDAREFSAMINACSRLGFSDVAFSLCIGNTEARSKAENIYTKYKQHLVTALNYAEQIKVEGKGYIILNAKDKIKDTIIGTVASILSMSKQYEAGTIIIAMSYDKEKIKVSARVAGRVGKNVREILTSAIETIGGECGGHPAAAGCLIPFEKEKEFLECIKKQLELEVVKI